MDACFESRTEPGLFFAGGVRSTAGVCNGVELESALWLSQCRLRVVFPGSLGLNLTILLLEAEDCLIGLFSSGASVWSPPYESKERLLETGW